MHILRSLIPTLQPSENDYIPEGSKIWNILLFQCTTIEVDNFWENYSTLFINIYIYENTQTSDTVSSAYR